MTAFVSPSSWCHRNVSLSWPLLLERMKEFTACVRECGVTKCGSLSVFLYANDCEQTQPTTHMLDLSRDDCGGTCV